MMNMVKKKIMVKMKITASHESDRYHDVAPRTGHCLSDDGDNDNVDLG